MIRPLVAVSILFAFNALAEEGTETQKPKLTVVPFAALTGEVPQRASTKAVGMLANEFKSADSFTLVDAKKDKGNDAAADALAAARKSVEEAKGLRGKKKFRLADEELQKAIASYKAGVTALQEIGEVADAYALLAAVQYNTGRDDEGAKSLATAIALAPDRDLPLAATSPLFAKVVADARKVAKDTAKGSLLLESSPSNAPVTVDGLALGATPLMVRDMPLGLHFWSATLPNGESIGGVVEVVAGKQAQAKAASSAKDPQSRLLSALAQNKLDADALAAAKEQAKAADADLVVFGALSKDGKGLSLDSFLFAAASGELRRLPRASFDTELLSAGMEFYNLAGELAKKGDKVGEGVKVPASVSLNLVVGGPKVAEAKYGVVPGKEVALEAIEGAGPEAGKGTTDGGRKPLEQKRRAPLKKQ